jgi:hypothetical protein
MGWRGDTGIDTFDAPITVVCNGYTTSPNDPRCKNAADLQQEVDRLQAEIDRVLGEGRLEDLLLALMESFRYDLSRSNVASASVRRWLASRLNIDLNAVTHNINDLAVAAAINVAGAFLALTDEGGSEVQIAMLQELRRMLAAGEAVATDIMQLVDDMAYADARRTSGGRRTPVSVARNFMLDPHGQVRHACDGVVVATNGGPLHNRSVCSADYYADLLPYDAQLAGMQLVGQGLMLAAAIYLTGHAAATGIAVVAGYSSLYAPYAYARLYQTWPRVANQIDRAVTQFHQMRVLGAVPNNVLLQTPSSNTHSPSFIVTPKGETIIVPKGAQGPLPTRAPGFQFIGGSGGHGLNARVTGVRIMEANRYQGRRAIYMNMGGQIVDPATGRTVANDDPRGHWYLLPW